MPEGKIRERYARLWDLVAAASLEADAATFHDNSRAASPFRRVGRLERGQVVGTPTWPAWTPAPLVQLGR